MKLFKMILPLAALFAVFACSTAVAAPAPWTDKNDADATVCSTYGRDGTQSIAKPSPGVDTTCVNPGGGEHNPPVVTITEPADGGSYLQGQTVTASFSCSDDVAVASCEAEQCPVVNGQVVTTTGSCIAILNGDALDTSTPGEFAFGVRAADSNGNTNNQWATFTVVADSDGDGVKDSDDLCPGTPAGASVDANGCSLSQKDTDGDGVKDSDDLCPTVAAATANGCPAGVGGGASTGGIGAVAGDVTNDDQLVLGARLTACKVTLVVKRKQKSFRSKGLAIGLRSDHACTIKLSGKLIPAKRKGARKAKVNTRTVSLKLKPGKTTNVKLPFTKKGLKYLKRSLKGKVTRGRIFVSDTAKSGKTQSFTIRIKG